MIDKNFRTREFYHFGIPLKNAHYCAVNSDSEDLDLHEKNLRSWLESIVGFNPVFIICGNHFMVFEYTGYANQFAKLISRSKKGSELRKKGEFPNQVMFSFDTIIPLNYIYHEWIGAMNDLAYGMSIEEVTEKWSHDVLKPDYSPEKWKEIARKNPGSVYAIVPEVDLRTATSIYVRNRLAEQQLEKRNFDTKKIKIERAKVYRYS